MDHPSPSPTPTRATRSSTEDDVIVLLQLLPAAEGSFQHGLDLLLVLLLLRLRRLQQIAFPRGHDCCLDVCTLTSM